MSLRFNRLCAAAALPLLLAACAAVRPPAAPTETAAAARSLQQTIDLAGRLSVRYQRNGSDEALHGSFLWRQNAAQTDVTLLSPLGQTIAIIAVTPAGAMLMQAGQAARHAADVDTLTANTLGWPLPVAGLRGWLQGFATDRAGRPFVATPQTTEVTTADGWRIRYASWQDDNATGQVHPKRIDLARDTMQAGEVSIRIVIDTWQAH